MSEVKELVRMNGKHIPILIEFDELPVFNPKCTHRRVTAYVGLGLKTYEKNGKTKTYLVALKNYSVKFSRNTVDGVVPIGAIIRISYSTGSNKYTVHEYYQLFEVVENQREEITICDDVGDEDVKARIVNLKPIPPLTKQTLLEIEAELLNKGWTPSQYDPVKTLYHYFIKEKRQTAQTQTFKIEFTIETAEDIDRAIEKLKELKEAMLKTPERIQSLLKSLT